MFQKETFYRRIEREESKHCHPVSFVYNLEDNRGKPFIIAFISVCVFICPAHAQVNPLDMIKPTHYLKKKLYKTAAFFRLSLPDKTQATATAESYVI